MSTDRKKSALSSKIEKEIKILERHILLLKTVRKEEPIGIIRLSELLKLPEHKVRYSLRILQQDGIIDPTPEGAVTTPKVREFLAELTDSLEHFSTAVSTLRETLK